MLGARLVALRARVVLAAHWRSASISARARANGMQGLVLWLMYGARGSATFETRLGALL